MDGVVAFYFTATLISFRRQVGRKQDLGTMLWEVRSSWCQGEGGLTGKMLLGKCMSCLLFFSRTAKVLAAIQSPSSRGPFSVYLPRTCPSSGPPAVSSFCVASPPFF